MMLKRILIVFVLVFAFVGCKQTAGEHDADYYKAKEYYAVGEYDKAHDYMLKAAIKGDTQAQVNLGWLYLNGVGVEQDTGKALEWYLSASELGCTEAMGEVGAIYVSGVAGEKNCKKGVAWVQRASSQGDASSTAFLARLYSKGLCVEQDTAKSNSLYQDLLRKGEISNSTLGAIYLFGKGVEKDYGKAIQYLKEAYVESPYSAGYYLGVVYQHGYGVDVDYVEAYKYFLESAKEGYTSSQYNVGVYLFNGKAGVLDREAAIKWVEVAANKNMPNALNFIGYLHEKGIEFDQNTERAIEYYAKAVSFGSEKAKQRLDLLQR